MATVINRDDLRSILRDWIAGRLSSTQVHEWAEARYATHTFEAEDDVVNVVLSDLDMLDLNLRTAEDAPILLQALDYSDSQLEEACALLDRHTGSIDLDARKRMLKGDPLYRHVLGKPDEAV